MLVYTTLAACAFLTAVIVYRYDLHAREPWPLLLLTLILGFFGMYAAGRLQVTILTRGGALAANHWNLSMAAVAAATEELTKLASVAVIAVAFRRWFDEPIDGVVYGAFAGLGAAINESIYRLHGMEEIAALPPSEPVRLAGHLVMGGIGGFGLGLALVWRRAWPLALAGTLAAAWLIHFLWDIIAFSAQDAGRMTPTLTCFAITLMVGGLVVFRWFVSLGSALEPSPVLVPAEREPERPRPPI